MKWCKCKCESTSELYRCQQASCTGFNVIRHARLGAHRRVLHRVRAGILSREGRAPLPRNDLLPGQRNQERRVGCVLLVILPVAVALLLLRLGCRDTCTNSTASCKLSGRQEGTLQLMTARAAAMDPTVEQVNDRTMVGRQSGVQQRLPLSACAKWVDNVAALQTGWDCKAAAGPAPDGAPETKRRRPVMKMGEMIIQG